MGILSMDVGAAMRAVLSAAWRRLASWLEDPGGARDVLILGAWFGVVAGLVEGAGLLAFQHFGVLSWFMATRGVTLEIVWISAAVNLVLFTGVGLVTIAAGRVFRRLATTRVAVVVFAFLTFFDWAALSDRISSLPALILATGLTTALVHWVSYRRTTPNVDRLAREGVLFENAIAPSSWTLSPHEP